MRPALGAAPRLAAAAATFTVNTTNDTSDANPGDGVCADSDGNCSLRAAIEEANASGTANPAMGTTDVNVPAGTYTLSSGEELSASDPAGLDIIGAGAGSTMIQQMASPTSRVLEVSQVSSTEGASVMLSGVTIQGGLVSDDVGGGIAIDDASDLVQLVSVTVTGNTAGFGGGVYNDGSLWATNSSISGNTADDSGGEPFAGGFYNDNAASLVNTAVNSNTANSATTNQSFGGGIGNDGSLIMAGGSVSGNTISSNGPSNMLIGGGGLYVDGATDLSGVTINNNSATASVPNHEWAYGAAIYDTFGLDSITNSAISGNTANGYFANGGAIAIDTAGATSISGSTLDNNQATAGGDEALGGAISTCCTDGTVTVTNSTLSGNTAADATAGGYGGAIWGESEPVIVTGSTLSNNTASGPDSGGGALYLDDGGTLTDTTIANNTVGNVSTAFGGGIYTASELNLIRSTVSGNSANEGGGLYLDDTLNAENSTIANNSTSGATDEGGGIFANGSIDVRFVTLNGNTSSDGSAIYNDGENGSIGSSIIQASCSSGGAVATGQFTSGGHNVLGDTTCVTPQSSDQANVSNFGLSALGNNGGPTQTEVPFSTSPAVGAGGTACPLTDQRGVHRPQGAACDSGAVEINQSYWMVASDGGIFTFGGAAFFGSMGGQHLNKPMVGMAAAPDGNGYWTVASDGGIFSFGPSAGFHGSTGSLHLNSPVVGMAATPDGQGYWLVASDGGIFAFGDAGFFGSMGGTHLNKPVVGMAAAAGGGYWLVASDGGIFSFGPGAAFHGSAGSLHLNAPVVGMSATPDGGGYWTVASDGGIFNYGDAGFFGSMGGTHLNKPVVGMAGSPVGQGYWLAASDGGIFAFGDAVFQGSMGAIPLNKPVVGIAST
ncbi:MAG TPA: choice-of-anchor Q domain-containing protein [Acidimicrobiales bacterium]|nr:choice-of-anchor Q domain-containing protein [Acidimicrobiales bacterium]